jgi:hypothetical protein
MPVGAAITADVANKTAKQQADNARPNGKTVGMLESLLKKGRETAPEAPLP